MSNYRKTNRLQRMQIVWKGERERLFIKLVNDGKAVTEIMSWFPGTSYRQIEYHLDFVCKKHGLKRPVPLKKRGTVKTAPKRQATNMMPSWDFRSENVDLPRCL